MASSIISTTAGTGAIRPKHPYGRRNTYIHPYVRHGLGYYTTEWEESLTVKFRNLPSRERRLYSLTLGYGLRNDNTSSRKDSNSRARLRMSRGYAVTLMARCHELLLHGGRTLEGIFEALGVDPSCVDADTFRVALDHILARAGTGVPTGRAEKFLAFLCQQGDVLWQFLDKYTADVRNTDGVQETTRHLARKTGHEAVLSDHSVKRVTSPDQVGVDAENDQGNRNPRDISFSLAQLSKALCTYRHERGEEAVEIGEATVQDLTNFLYLDGQTKVRLSVLRAFVDKYGRWALEHVRRQLRDEKAKLAEAATRAEAGHAFTLSPKQLDSVVDFLDPNKDGHIDFEELVHAFKTERSAITILSKDSLIEANRREGTSMATEGTMLVGLMTNPTNTAQERIVRAEKEDVGGVRVEADQETGAERGERGLFSVEEANALTAYLVESQQAISLLNVADIQHGLRGAKRAGAQLATRRVHKAAARRLAAEMQAAGIMIPGSDDAWKRWFDMCELGLRAGGREGSKRLVGRQELKRGLKALSTALKSVKPGAMEAAASGSAEGWSEQEVDDLLKGLGVGGDERVDTGKDRDITEKGFRESLTLALDDDSDNQLARDFGAGLETLPLCERLESHLKDKGLRLIDLFARMVIWAKDAQEEDLVYPATDGGTSLGAPEIPKLPVQRGDESCVPPAALRCALLSLTTGGATAAERAKTKDVEKSAQRVKEERRIADAATDEAARRLGEAERSGALAVLSLLRSSIAAKGVRIIDLFRQLDSSRDGLISREELGKGLQIIAKMLASRPSLEQRRKDCRDRKKSQIAKDTDEKERLGGLQLRQRITASETSGAAKVLRRIDEHLTRTGQKVVGMFQFFSLRGDLHLTTAELEMALSLVDGLDLTRREVRSVVCFLDKDSSGTVDIGELDQAVRDFRALSKANPSLGAGPMTVVDPKELDRLTSYIFSEMLHRSFDDSGKSDCSEFDKRSCAEEKSSENCDNTDSRTTFGQAGAEDVSGEGERSQSEHCTITGYRTGIDSTNDLPLVGTIATALGESSNITHNVTTIENSDKKDIKIGIRAAATVSVSEISVAFEAAARMFKARDRHGRVGSAGVPGDRYCSAYLSTDMRRAQASVDKVMEWLRSSRTFDRAPTGRAPTLAEKMTERQKMEMELQNKLQEKRRREAGQRHWEQWAASKRVNMSRSSSVSGCANDPREAGRESDVGIGRHERKREIQQSDLKRKAQDEAFEAWTKEKDRLSRARRREKRRELSAIGSRISLRSINSKLREARIAAPNGASSRFPHLSGPPDNQSNGRSADQQDACSSLGSPGATTSRHSRIPSKAERKALNLAVTRVAVSPYLVGAKEQYEHAKHIVGADIVAALVRNPSAPLPKGLIEEGWNATLQLLRSSCLSRISDRSPAQASPSSHRRASSGKLEDQIDKNVPKGKHTCGQDFFKRHAGKRRRRTGRRRPHPPRSTRPVAPGNTAYQNDSSISGDEAGGRARARGTTSMDAASGNADNGAFDGNGDSRLGLYRSQQRNERKNIAHGRQQRPASATENAENSRADIRQETTSNVSIPRAARGGTPSGAERESPPIARGDAGERPSGRRGNSRGADDGEGGRGGDAVAGEFQRPEGIGRRDSGESMEFPIQSQALPDWADTIKNLPIDDPYEEYEDDF